MKKRFLYLLLLIILFASLNLPFWNSLKSYTIMYFYNKKQIASYEKGFSFYIPSGLKTLKEDWYPIMLHHDASKCFSQYIGKDVSLKILYSFGSFDFFKGCSYFYDASSPYYAAFYGGYVVSCEDTPYGFDEKGKMNIEEIEKVPMFDQTHLVLPSIGCPKDKIYFDSTVKKIAINKNYIGMDGWTRIDAKIKTNAPIHKNMDKKNIGYIQYGKPHKNFYDRKEYPLISLHGRIYVKYIDDLKKTFFLYVMAKDIKTINLCDKEFLSQSSISIKNH